MKFNCTNSICFRYKTLFKCQCERLAPSCSLRLNAGYALVMDELNTPRGKVICHGWDANELALALLLVLEAVNGN